VKNLYKLLSISLLIFVSFQCFAQKNVVLIEDRTSPIVEEFYELWKTMPKEVLFGVDIHKNGEVYFSMSNKKWFYRLFLNSKDGVAIDLVSRDIYDCGETNIEHESWQRGEWTKPVFLKDLTENIRDLGNGYIKIKVGEVPEHLKDKELEGYIGFIKNGKVVHYQSFVNIDRSVFQILPMGLFTDDHVKYEEETKIITDSKPAIYTKKMQFVIPFQKNKYDYNSADIQPLYDSLHLIDYTINKIIIRAYSSVEGSEEINRHLQEKRADAIVKVLQQFQNAKIETEISTAENWVEFQEDIKNTPFENLSSLRNPDIKGKLFDKDFASKLEPILQNHRKAIITIFLDKRTGFEDSKDPSSFLGQFKKAIQERNIEKAGSIQKEVFDRISDNRLPSAYLNKLEIPEEKPYISLLNNQTIYQYLISNQKKENMFEKGIQNVEKARNKSYSSIVDYDFEALEQLIKFQQIEPENAKLNYNICSLKFNIWKFDTTIVSSSVFWNEIMKVRNSDEIDVSLARRMIINYHILMSEQHQSRLEYRLKDIDVSFIYAKYKDLQLNDKELFSLVKYLTYYSREGEAKRIITERLGKIDIDEDLLFYYVNLMFFDKKSDSSFDFRKAVENAVGINEKRFCHFFDSIDKGGAGFSLFEKDHLRKFYCKYCNK
jgi:hypothetical protein